MNLMSIAQRCGPSRLADTNKKTQHKNIKQYYNLLQLPRQKAHNSTYSWPDHHNKIDKRTKHNSVAQPAVRPWAPALGSFAQTIVRPSSCVASSGQYLGHRSLEWP